MHYCALLLHWCLCVCVCGGESGRACHKETTGTSWKLPIASKHAAKAGHIEKKISGEIVHTQADSILGSFCDPASFFPFPFGLEGISINVYIHNAILRVGRNILIESIFNIFIFSKSTQLLIFI